MDFDKVIDNLKHQGNFRSIPEGNDNAATIDFSSNDYLGIADDAELLARFKTSVAEDTDIRFTSSAARLLSGRQVHHIRLEHMLGELYGRHILIMNSGYHANTGAISALAAEGTLIVADKLVHASIIDGITLSRAPFERFRHNDMDHLRRILRKKAGDYERVLIVTESVFSMDGDTAPLDELAAIKREFANSLLYVDEAHAFGVLGPHGLGLCHGMPEADIIVGTFGKAAASYGAFIATADRSLTDFMINRARSFIFSTALPPVNCAWTIEVIRNILSLDSRRQQLAELGNRLAAVLQPYSATRIPASHIQPLIIGDAVMTVRLSGELARKGFKVLPIRTPTVPPGTERLRFSLSTSIKPADIDRLGQSLSEIMS